MNDDPNGSRRERVKRVSLTASRRRFGRVDILAVAFLEAALSPGSLD